MLSADAGPDLGAVVGGRYELVTEIGTGGMSTVYRATDRRTGEAVAVKVLRGVDPSFQDRFAREASALLQLDDPAIVRLRDEGVDSGRPYLVLDLVDGPSLAELLAQGPLPEDEVARIGAVVAGALAHAHDAGMVHRDVKPANIILDGERDPKLVDFGIAVLADTTAITGVGTVVGTASYLAPEQLRGDGTGPPADVYSLGLVLIEALSGHRAFPGTPAEAAGARLVGPPAVPDGASAWLAGLLAAMTALDATTRPTAAGVALSLAARAPLAAAGPVAAPAAMTDDTVVTYEPTDVLPIAPVVPTDERARKGRIAVVAAAVVVALLLALGLAAAQSGPDSPPVEAGTTTTAVATTVPPTTAAPPVTDPPTTKAPAGKGKGKDKGD